MNQLQNLTKYFLPQGDSITLFVQTDKGEKSDIKGETDEQKILDYAQALKFVGKFTAQVNSPEGNNKGRVKFVIDDKGNIFVSGFTYNGFMHEWASSVGVY